jgi:hypothetical protein
LLSGIITGFSHHHLVSKTNVFLGEILSALGPVRSLTAFKAVVFLIAVAMGLTVMSPVHASGDTAGPVLVSSSVSPTSFNLKDGPAVVTVTLHLTDTTGVRAPYLNLSHSGTDQGSGFGSTTLVSGTIQDGTWERTMTIPQGSATGQWDVVLYPLNDTLGNNSTFFQTIATLTVDGEPSDTAGPVLLSSSVSPKTFNLNDGPAVVRVSLHLTDKTGLNAPYLNLSHNGTDQGHGFGSMTLVSGTTQDGTWERTMTIPQGSATGQWDVVAVVFTDKDGTAEDTYTIPATKGVDYLIGEKTVEAGTYPGTGTLTVTAKAQPDYVLAAGTATEWTTTFKATPFQVTAAAVVFTDKDGTAEDTYTIPATKGVDYLIGEKTVEAGTYPGTGTLTVTAKAQPDYVLAAGTATEWTTTFKATPFQVTAAAVVFTDKDGTAEDTYTIPATKGVDYLIGEKTIEAGTYPGTGTLTVTAKAQPDYVLAAGTATEWTTTFKATPFQVTAAAVVFTDKDGTAEDTYTIPATKGVDYLIGEKTVEAGTYPGTGTLTVTAKAQPDYVLAAGTATEWTTTFKGYTSVTKTSTATATIAAGALTAAPTPTITGTKKVGYTLIANPGIWGPAPLTLRYQWYRTGIAITGATAASYRLNGADAGKTISVRVTGSKTGYTSVTKASITTATIAAGGLTAAPTPTITGTKKVGYTLIANPGIWGPAPLTLRYQWYRTGIAITGATAATYRLDGADAGKIISVRVTGSKTGYASVTKASAATSAIAVGSLSPAPIPTITGTKKVGYTLTANPGIWGPAPVTLRYQWYRNGLPIGGAVARSYELTSADAGKAMAVRVTGSKAGYGTLARSSASTPRTAR